MRLIGFLPFLLIGIVVGLAATHLFNRSPITAFVNCVLGVVAATFALFFRDLLGFESGILSGLVAAFLGSVIIVFVANLLGPYLLSSNDDHSEH